MKNINLSKRLRLIADFVTEGYAAADIGTDHGYIPVWLVENGIIPRGFAMDIRKAPLERAKKNIELYGLEEKIELRLSDGLTGLKENEADSVIIAGMGGELIVSILKKGESVLNTVKELILSPHTEAHIVRHYLIENGYNIVREEMVHDMGKYYTVIKAVHTEDKSIKTIYDGDEYNYIYGRLLLLKKDKVFIDFINNERQKLELVLTRLSDSSESEEKKHEIAKRLKYINENILTEAI